MQAKYENFPFIMIALANLVSLSIYGIGIFIFARLGIIFAVLYAAYCVWMEMNVLRRSCVNCYYYDKFCGLGKGKLCAMFFAKGDAGKFVDRQVTWRDIIPDFMVSVFPLLGGVVLLIRQFSWGITIALALMVVLSFAGNAFVRGSFACKYCKQMDLGCPAAQLFNKTAN